MVDGSLMGDRVAVMQSGRIDHIGTEINCPFLVFFFKTDRISQIVAHGMLVFNRINSHSEGIRLRHDISCGQLIDLCSLCVNPQ
jgi:hypothetical protein